MTMNNIQRTYCLTLSLLLIYGPACIAAEHMHDHGDNPMLSQVLIDQLELQSGENHNATALEAQAWIGKDLDKLWLKADATWQEGTTETLELQALYDRALTPFWDLQMGLRHDANPTPTRDWAVIGVQGLAPYWFEVETALFVGQSGALAARLKAEYEVLFTQRLVLTPSIELNAYSQNDAQRASGSGLSEIQTGLRLRYEIRREFAPYIGINWTQHLGNTADFLEASNQETRNTQWVIGLRAWF
jgi:copper resistance protein B